MFRAIMGLPWRDRPDFTRMRGCFDDAGGAGGAGGSEQPITFNTAQDFHSRMDREATTRLEKQAKDAGFENCEAMLNAAKFGKETADKNKTEAEKEKERAANAETEAKTNKVLAETLLIDTRIEIEATRLGAIKPEQVATLIDRSSIKVKDLAAKQVDGVKEAVEAFKKDNEHLFGTGTPGRPGGMPGSAGGGQRQSGGGGTDQAGDFGKKLAEKNSGTVKAAVDHQKTYFGN